MAFASRQNSTPMILASGPTSQIQELFSDKQRQEKSIQPLPPARRTQKQENCIQLSSTHRTFINSTTNRKRQIHNSIIEHDETALESKKRKEQDVVENGDEISLIMTADDQDQDEETEEQTRDLETPNVAEHTRETPNVVPQISDREVMNSSYYEDLGLAKLNNRNNSINHENSCSKSNTSSNNSNSGYNSKNSNDILTICEYILTGLAEMNKQIVQMDNRLKVIEDKQDKMIESVEKIQKDKDKTDMTDENSLEEDVGSSQINELNSRLKSIENKQIKLIETVEKLQRVNSNTDGTSSVEDGENSACCTIEENDPFWLEEEDEDSDDQNEMLKNTTDEPTGNSTESGNCQTIVNTSSSEDPSKKSQAVQSSSAKNVVARKYNHERKWKDIQADQEHRNPLLTGLKVYSKKEETAKVAGIVSPDESILSTHKLKMLFLQAVSPANFAVLILRKIKPEFEHEHIRQGYSWRGVKRTNKKPISVTVRKFIKKCMVNIYPDTKEHENFITIVNAINESLRRKPKKPRKKEG